MLHCLLQYGLQSIAGSIERPVSSYMPCKTALPSFALLQGLQILAFKSLCMQLHEGQYPAESGPALLLLQQRGRPLLIDYEHLAAANLPPGGDRTNPQAQVTSSASHPMTLSCSRCCGDRMTSLAAVL